MDEEITASTGWILVDLGEKKAVFKVDLLAGTSVNMCLWDFERFYGESVSVKEVLERSKVSCKLL